MKWRREYKWAIFKALLDSLFKYFCIVATVLIVVSWGRAWFSGNDWALYSQDLVRILLIAFFGGFPALLTAVVETASAKGKLAEYIIRFFTTAVLVLGTHVVTEQTGSGITLDTIISFLLIYAAIVGYSYMNATNIELEEKKLAEQINQQLNEFHKDENETHEG